MRWSMPRDPGRPLAALPGHVAGGEHHRGHAVGERRAVVLAQRRDELRLLQQLLGRRVPGELRVGVVQRGAGGCGRATSAICSTVALPESSSARACRAARLTESGHSGPTEYGSSWRVITIGRSPGDDLP